MKNDNKIIKEGFSQSLNKADFVEAMKEEMELMTLDELKELHKSVPGKIKIELLLNKSKTKK